MELINVHDPALCEGGPCTIHHPSEHHMVTWPQNWRGDQVVMGILIPGRKIMERLCPHGIGHPDPDDIRIVNREDPGVHGCDGCCVEHIYYHKMGSHT